MISFPPFIVSSGYGCLWSHLNIVIINTGHFTILIASKLVPLLPSCSITVYSQCNNQSNGTKSDHIMSLLLNPIAPILLREQDNVLTITPKVLKDLDLLFLWSHLLLLSITHSALTTLTVMLPQNGQHAQPQGLWNCCSLCLKCSSPNNSL